MARLVKILALRNVTLPCHCIAGNFSGVKTLANLAISSFSPKLQVTSLVLHCSTVVQYHIICTMKNAKSLN